MKSNFNNQQFVDRFSEGLTTINKRTTERNIAIGTAVVLGVVVAGYVTYKMYLRFKERTAVPIDVISITKEPIVATKEQQQADTVQKDQPTQSSDGVTMFAEPEVFNKKDM